MVQGGVEDRGQIEIEAVNWDVGTDAVRDGEVMKVDIASENVDDLFEANGSETLNEGLHKIGGESASRTLPQIAKKVKLELFALGAQRRSLVTSRLRRRRSCRRGSRSTDLRLGNSTRIAARSTTR